VTVVQSSRGKRVTHGDIRYAPGNLELEGRKRGGTSDNGCKICESSCRTRFPPAESPVRRILDGLRPCNKRCCTALTVWISGTGKCASGTRAIGMDVSNILTVWVVLLTVIEHRDPNIYIMSSLQFILNVPPEGGCIFR